MKKQKLKRFREINTFPNVINDVIQSFDPPVLRKSWESAMPGTEQDITLELGCGAGDYTLGLARLYPDRNFIGIDIKGARIWKGAKKALELELHNVLFIRMHIDFINMYFPEGSISEIWLPFPDPQLKKPGKYYSKRLTSDSFIFLYKKILKRNGMIHLKTDNSDMYNYTLKSIVRNGGRILRNTHDLYASSISDTDVLIQTHYEKRYLDAGRKIKYIQFVL